MTDTSREAIEQLILAIPGEKPLREVWELLDRNERTLRALLEERDILRTEAHADAEAIGALREVLARAVTVMDAAIRFEDAAQEHLSESDYELNMSLSDPAAEIVVCGPAALADARAALEAKS